MLPSTDKRVAFTKLSDATKADISLLNTGKQKVACNLGDRLLGLLQLGGGVECDIGLRITMMEHGLQSATRAAEAGETDAYVVAALLHDCMDLFATDHHGAIIATILSPFVDDRIEWILKHHGIFQEVHRLGGDKQAREKYRGHPYFEDCAVFCANYDQVSFDDSYPTRPLSSFEPLVQRILAKPLDK